MLVLFGNAATAVAAACSNVATGNWTAAATWAAPCNVAGGPTAADMVTVINNTTVTVDAAGLAANSLTIATGNRNSTLTFAPGSSLAVTNNVIIDLPTANSRTKSIAVLTGALTVGGNVTLNGGTAATRDALLSVSTGSIVINGGLIISSTVATSSTVSLTGAGTITVNGAAGVANGDRVSIGTGTFNVTNAVAAFTNSSTANIASTTISTGTLNVAGNLTNAAGETITVSGTGHINVGGNWNNSGTFTAGSGTVTFNGTAQQTLTGATTFNNLTVNNAAGIALANNITATSATAGAVTLTSGVVTTGANVLIVPRPCNAPSVGRTGGWVNGKLQKAIPAGASTCNFEVGDATNYTPVSTTFAAGTTAGNLTASTTAAQHTQIGSSGVDPTNMVNRYWTLTNGGVGLPAGGYSATFNFINPGDLTTGATPTSFEVMGWNGAAWVATTLVAANSNNTQASGISGFGDFAVGKKGPVIVTPSSFNTFETATSAGAITGVIKTRIAGSAFSLDVVAISGGAQMSGFTGAVKVELLANGGTPGSGYGADNCPTSNSVLQTITPASISAGRSTVNFSAVADVYRDVRVRISFPTTSPTVTSCSTDSFAIRPSYLAAAASDADWQTAGVSRVLSNSGASGGNVHKAGQPFTISATAYNAAATPAITTNYSGSPAATVACTLPPPTCSNGVLTLGTWSAASGTVTTSTANYAEAGAFDLTLQDTAFASIDSGDGTTADCTGYYVCAAAVSVGRFVPDHFVLTASNTPQFKTFNVADAACSAGAAPRRTFTYIGQPFGYATVPQALVIAKNMGGVTTINYRNNLWKLATAAGTLDCTTNPDICTLTSGNVTQTYTYATVPVATPNWDSPQVSLGTPAIAANNDGTGTVTGASGDLLAFKRNLSAPQSLFTADITLTESVKDTSEAGNCGTANCDITTSTSATFNPIAFDAGNEFRYGRLKLSSAYGSELLDLPVPFMAEYYNGTAFVTNAADNCTQVLVPTVANGDLTKNPAALGTSATINGVAAPASGKLVSGDGRLKFSKPGAKGYVDITIGDAPAYLRYDWNTAMPGLENPSSRATFGVYKGGNEFIYLREVY